MSRPLPPFIAFYLSALMLSLTLIGALWHALGRPHTIPEAVRPDARLQCVSYSPFGKHQSPFDGDFRADPARIDADLAQLAQRFSCIRTYSVSGLQAIPAIAEKYGLKVLLGAWISADHAASEREIEALVQLANAHPDSVETVVVGNEALLRKEVTASHLAALITRVRQQVAQPVTYADVWEFWLQHPEIAPAVDFLTIHLLPYWEDEPVGIDAALARVVEVRRLFGERYAPKDILIGETGWPSEGRQRETALPSRVEQARFIRGFLALAEQHGWRYNLIEAYDQPWKRISEGAVGGYWGLFDADRQDKGILEGPVSNLPDWHGWLLLSLALFGLTLGIAGRPNSRRAAVLLPLLAALGACCIAYSARQAGVTSRFFGEWLGAAALLALNLIVLAHAALALSAGDGWRGRLFAALERRSGWWLAAAGFAGAVLMLGLVFDARYRDFPLTALALPALVYLCRPVDGPRREMALLAALIAAGIAPQLLQETLDNHQALGWAAVCLLLVGALWRSLHASRQPADAVSGEPAAGSR